jgi:hypothetical protein
VSEVPALAGLSLSHTARDAAVYSAVLVGFILLSLRVNSRIWIQDLPEAVRATLPPLTASERRLRALFGTALLLVLFGGLTLSALQLRATSGTLGLAAGILHVYLVFAAGVLADTFVLDYLILSVLRPRFAAIPGTAGMEHLFLTLRYHLKDMWKGLAGGILVAAIIGFLTTR